MKFRKITFEASPTSLGPSTPFVQRMKQIPFIEPEESGPSPQTILIPDSIRPQGLYIAGNPGYGKSSLIQNLVLSDISAGYGVCVIDPSGELISRVGSTDGIIDWIPESRIEDVIYFNTSSHVRSIDFLSYHDSDERRVLLDELVAIFKLENAPRARPLLRKVLGLLLTANTNGGSYTFLDIQTFIEDEDKREEILKQAKSEWYNFPKPSEFEAVTTRLIPFAEDPILRQIVTSSAPAINLWDIMQNNKILLVDLQDTETDHFIGSLITAKIQQATFRRRFIPKSEQKLFFLYVDEFHAITPSSGEQFEKMLTRARKYNLCLTLANPYPDDLPADIQRKLPGIATKILFQLDQTNSLIFKHQLARKELCELGQDVPAVLAAQQKFQAVCIRPESYPIFVPTPRFLPPNPASCAERIKKRTGDDGTGNTAANVVPSKQDAPSTSKGNASDPTFSPKRPKKTGS